MKEDQSMFSSITKSTSYAETCLKLLVTFDEMVTAEDLGQLYTVLVAHINCLQSQYSGLVIKGQFAQETATVFKCLQKNTTCFKVNSLDNLKTAAEIAAVRDRTVRKETDNY